MCSLMLCTCSSLRIFYRECHPSVYKGATGSKEGLSLFGKRKEEGGKRERWEKGGVRDGRGREVDLLIIIIIIIIRYI